MRTRRANSLKLKNSIDWLQELRRAFFSLTVCCVPCRLVVPFNVIFSYCQGIERQLNDNVPTNSSFHFHSNARFDKKKKKNAIRCHKFLTSTSPVCRRLPNGMHNRKSIERRRLHHRKSKTEYSRMPNKSLSVSVSGFSIFFNIYLHLLVRSPSLLNFIDSSRHTSWINYDYAFWFAFFLHFSFGELRWIRFYYALLLFVQMLPTTLNERRKKGRTKSEWGNIFDDDTCRIRCQS